MEFPSLLSSLREEGAEELILPTSRRPYVKTRKGKNFAATEAVTLDALESLLHKLIDKVSPTSRQRFECGRWTVCEYEDLGRLKLRLVRDSLGPILVLRRISPNPVPLEQLGPPEAVKALHRTVRGLVIAAGPPCSGKTTVLTAMLDALNSSTGPCQPFLAVTVEDPIEYIHCSKQALVVQLEVGTHCEDMASGVRLGFSIGAQVILVGGVEDLPTAEAALDAAQAGTLVLTEVTAHDVAAALEKILGFYPAERTAAARAKLAGAFAGGFSVRQLPRRDAQGTIWAWESVAATPAVVAAIRESGGAGITGLGDRTGVTTLDSALLELVGSGAVLPADAARFAQSGQDFLRRCELEGLRAAPPHPEGKESGHEQAPARPENAGGIAPRPRQFTTRRLSRAEMFLGAQDAPPDAGRSPSPNALSGKRVLVIDDDDCVRELIARILKSAGADVIALGEPARALETLRTERFDLIVSDILMPGCTGTELYDELVQLNPGLREKVLFVTAHDLNETLAARIASRGGKVVRKPFSAEDLLKAATFTLTQPVNG